MKESKCSISDENSEKTLKFQNERTGKVIEIDEEDDKYGYGKESQITLVSPAKLKKDYLPKK